MDESRLSMSKLASESGKAAVRSGSGERDNDDGEQLNFSRLEQPAGGADGTEAGGRDASLLRLEATQCYTAIYDAAHRDKPFAVEPAVAVIKKLIAGARDSDGLLLGAIHDDYREDVVIHHSVNVAIFAVMIGGYLGISGSGLINLGIVALLHDIGTARVPVKIFYKPAALTDDELRQVRQRPLFTRQILSGLAPSYAFVPEIAVQVYERLDGSGYPSALKEGAIHEYARIIGLADVCEALIHSRPHRDRFLHFPAIKEILRSGKESFDRRHLKALVHVVSLFPVSSYVRLNSGAIGRVLETDQQYPLRPRLEILFDSQKRPVSTGRIVKLRENALLYVDEAVSEAVIRAGSA